MVFFYILEKVQMHMELWLAVSLSQPLIMSTGLKLISFNGLGYLSRKEGSPVSAFALSI